MCRCVLAGLEIWGPYYHCLLYWRGLRGGKECPLAPPTLPTHPSTALTPPHTHSSHILIIGLSIFLSLLASVSIQLQLISHFTSQRKGLHATSAAVQRVDKHKKGAKANSSPRCKNPHDDLASNRPRRKGTFSLFPNPFSREGGSLLSVRERSYTCMLAAAKTSC